MKLNLGSGDKRLAGYRSVDLFAAKVDQRADLFRFPWPWKTGSVDAIAMFHFLEHVPDLEQTLMECHRVLRRGGEFWVIVPHAFNPAAHDISHTRYFTAVTFQTIACRPCPYRWGGKQIFQTRQLRLQAFNSRMIKRTPLDWIASRWPVFWEKCIPIAPAHIEWKGIAV